MIILLFYPCACVLSLSIAFFLFPLVDKKRSPMLMFSVAGHSFSATVLRGKQAQPQGRLARHLADDSGVLVCDAVVFGHQRLLAFVTARRSLRSRRYLWSVSGEQFSPLPSLPGPARTGVGCVGDFCVMYGRDVRSTMMLDVNLL